MTLAELNACDRDRFVESIGWVFEQSPWVAERAWSARPFVSVDALHAALDHAMTRATRDEQLALLRAHPDLGTRARMTDSSTAEQAGAGLDRMTPESFARLQRLNGAYTRQFAFPFLFAVRGSTAEQILAALDRRLGRSAAEEFAEALRQVSRIARFRLESTVTSEN